MKIEAMRHINRVVLFPGIVIAFFVVSAAVFAETGHGWDKKWTQYQKVLVQEVAGYDRSEEPVETEIKFYQQMPSRDEQGIDEILKREIRVVRCSPEKKWTEIPSQVYDVRTYHWNRRSEKPELYVRVRVAFFATVPAHMTEAYYIFYGNPDATAPEYTTDLKVTGEGVKYKVDTSWYSILTDEKSGQIDQIDLKFATKPSLRFRSGNLHWNPDYMFVPDDFPTTFFTWFYAHHFENPPHEMESGPIFFSIKRSQLIPGQDVAYMEVYYRFYAGQPYFIMESLIEVTKKAHTLAIRNDELAFGTDDFTHAGWRNRTPDMMEKQIGEIGSVDVYNTARKGNHVLGSALPPNIAWISLCHVERGYGVGSIRLAWENKNRLTGEPSPLYNSHTVISEHGGGLYWFRSLVYSPRDDYNEWGWTADDWRSVLIDIPKGSSYYEKNAYMMYEWDKEGKFAAIDNQYFKLHTPLKVSVAR